MYRQVLLPPTDMELKSSLEPAIASNAAYQRTNVVPMHPYAEA